MKLGVNGLDLVLVDNGENDFGEVGADEGGVEVADKDGS